MFVACLVVTILFAALLLMSAQGKFAKQPRVVDTLGGLGVPLSWFPLLGAAEIAGAIGLLIGLAWAPLGIAAAIGLVGYFAGAIITHLRAGDVRGIGSPMPMLLLAIAALVLRIASM